MTLEILQSGTFFCWTLFINQFNMLRVFSPGEARHDKLLLDSRHHYPRSNQVRTAALTSKEIMLATIYNFQVWHKKFTKHPKPTTIFNNPNSKLTFRKEDIFTALLTVPNSFRQRRRDNSACFYCQAWKGLNFPHFLTLFGNIKFSHRFNLVVTGTYTLF